MSKDKNIQQEFLPRSKKHKKRKQPKRLFAILLATITSFVIAASSLSLALGYWNVPALETKSVEVLKELEGNYLPSTEHSLKDKPFLHITESSQDESLQTTENRSDIVEEENEEPKEKVEKFEKEKNEAGNDSSTQESTPQENVGSTPELNQPKFVVNHEVQPKETLFSITMQYFSTSHYQERIAKFNDIHNPSTEIKAGTILKIPDPELVTIHKVKSGETLFSITRTYYNTTEHLISLANYNNIVDPKRDVKLGMDLKIPHPTILKNDEKDTYSVHINKSKNTLTVYFNSEVVRSFPVATGKEQSVTPEGIFQIVNKVEDPWYSPKDIPGGSPENPLGSHWLGLNVPGTNHFTYGIHGTNDPSSIGKHVSLGCIRMHNSDVLWMYDTIPLHTSVYIFSE
ncbi:lipoprotein-anchoring transpeptidase ErfK/SrfK [Evansella vedderi]|uniref:Lipoprotein-anchoring transpeptidase ErfK/SrfK n=1 Tax=Evansella vedderi TaxID=38282 RepID=A0ABT9ZVQ0_9BACI|nr:L,D-transpeptidase family protein [Evansella vedderi]MDQ0255289.1 lipoprotein-anchoring transpeptidase ErfK/SrfK [Evansella vedderi]